MAELDEGRAAHEAPGRVGPAAAQLRATEDVRPQSTGDADPDTILEVRDLSCGYDKTTIIDRANFSMRAGSFTCIIGANGCGKTTLLKTILGLLRPLGGGAYVRGEAVAQMDDRRRARALAYIPQAHRPPFPFKVADVVLMGRTPHVGRFSSVSHADKRAAWDALCLLGIEGLAQAVYTRLSGGQQQLVLIARALAQQPELIVMDEPTASLDFGNQHMVLSRMRDLSREGASVLMVTHDPHHAIFCADSVVVVKDRHVDRVGTPDEIITGPTLRSIYGVPVDVVEAPLTDGGTSRVCVAL